MALDEREPLKNLAPSHLAAEVISNRPLVYAMGMWLEYRAEKGHYLEIDQKALTSAIYRTLDGRSYIDKKGATATLYVDTRLSANVREAMIHLCLVEEVDDLPFWLPSDEGDHYELPDPASLLPVSNGLLNWQTGAILPPTRRLVSTNCAAVEFDPLAAEPFSWDMFLDEIFEGDCEQIDLLHEVLGAILTGQHKYQKVYQLFGPTRSGKGTIGRMLVELLGIGAVASPKIRQIAKGSFGLQSLIGKSVAMVTDARLDRGEQTSALTEIMLTTSGGDIQTIERKYKDDFIGYLHAQWLLMSNEPILLSDLTGTVAKRMVLMETRRGFYGQEDPDLFDRDLRPEASGVLNRCLDGARRLASRGRFLTPTSIRNRQAEIVRETSTVAGFANECLSERGAAKTTKDEIYAAYNRYCVGHRRPRVTDNVFWRDLRASGKFQDSMVRRLRIDGERKLVVEGLCLDGTAIPEMPDFDREE